MQGKYIMVNISKSIHVIKSLSKVELFFIVTLKLWDMALR